MGSRIWYSLAAIANAIWDNNYVALASRTVTVSSLPTVINSIQHVGVSQSFSGTPSDGSPDVTFTSVDQNKAWINLDTEFGTTVLDFRFINGVSARTTDQIGALSGGTYTTRMTIVEFK